METILKFISLFHTKAFKKNYNQKYIQFNFTHYSFDDLMLLVYIYFVGIVAGLQAEVIYAECCIIPLSTRAEGRRTSLHNH